MADPPKNSEVWEERRPPDLERLRERLDAFAPAFNLTGEGPLFLQDLEPLAGEPNSPDMLFIDSAGENTAKNNADLMVRRGRYPALDPAMAAMALYAFQAYAPSGGAGNRTSMRGGGPLSTLVVPGRGLWEMVWANVPYGVAPAEMDRLPWMRKTRVSDKGLLTTPADDVPKIEAFFGMPRRLRLIEENGAITGVIQRPWGTNYAQWPHPLTPYYRQKATDPEWLPVHPRAGRFSYRHWLGILAQAEKTDALRERAETLRLWSDRSGDERSTVLVAGWAMDNMKPRDFTWSVQPFVKLEDGGEAMLRGLILAAEQAALALRAALGSVLGEGETRENLREAFYDQTQDDFLWRFEQLKTGVAPKEVAMGWLADLKRKAMELFEAAALPGLEQRDSSEVERILRERRFLFGVFSGHGKYGGGIFGPLKLEPPPPPKKTKEKAS